ncbi:hypothetical protein I5523_08545 [Acinetobacter oleivorans]|uniref:hypothetical protein n=1 Tax=Acinetobacter oleivorans TaxID=1148157 RepID=UPI001902AE1E|nr:hypothetical protein [Acinetobacter oleivorans]MBJ9739691.1 hypothetical protein [Acinetobacter oleivorans]MCU4409691.1 hypothetical protein [Acinetobacter oleivorans]
MAEPVTTAALVAIVVEQAAQELGKRIGGAIADRLFGSELSENQALLKSISRDVREILTDVKKIYSIVITIPDIVQGEILRNELYKAHININSNIEAFYILNEWNGSLGKISLVEVLNSWKLICDKEDNVEMIWEIPRYADFIMIITRNKAKELVLSGLDYKIEVLESRRNVLYNDFFLKTVNDIEKIFNSSEYINYGRFISENPWIEFSMKPDKTKTVKSCMVDIPKDPKTNSEKEVDSLGDYFIERLECKFEEVPDTAWNNQRNYVNSLLQNSSLNLNNYILELRTVIATLTLLTTYKEKLANGIPNTTEADSELINSDNLFSLR